MPDFAVSCRKKQNNRNKHKDICVYLAWRREGSGETSLLAFQYLRGAYKQEGEWLFVRVDSDRTRGMVLN